MEFSKTLRNIINAILLFFILYIVSQSNFFAYSTVLGVLWGLGFGTIYHSVIAFALVGLANFTIVIPVAISACLYIILSLVNSKFKNSIILILLSAAVTYIPYIFFVEKGIVFHVFGIFFCCFVALISKFSKNLIENDFKSDSFFKSLSLGVLTFFLGSGGCEISFWQFELFFMMLPIILFFTPIVLDEKDSFIVIMFFLLGGATPFSQHILLLSMLIFALRSCFKKQNFILVLIMSFLMFSVGIYFLPLAKGTFVGLLLSFFVGLAVCAAIPKRLINFHQIGNSKNESKTINVVNINRVELSQKIWDISDLFKEISLNFDTLAKKQVNIKNFHQELKEGLLFNFCLKCKNKKSCYDKFALEIENQMSNAVKLGLKNQVSILNVEERLSCCLHLKSIVDLINDNGVKLRNFLFRKKIFDEAKGTISDKCMGISKVLKELSDETSKKIFFDAKKQGEIFDRLNLMVPVKDVLVFKDCDDLETVILTTKSELKIEELLASEISKTLRKSFVFVKKDLKTKDFSSYVFKLAPKFCVDFDVYTNSKSGENGDTYSVIKTQSKMLFAISDGMGNGEKAREFSENTLNILENLFKCGFSKDLILSLLNSIMISFDLAIYATLDILEIDLMTGKLTFIKAGASESYFMTDQLEIVEGSALPIGIVENIKIAEKEKWVENFGKIIMASDGFTDNVSGEIVSVLYEKKFLPKAVTSWLNELCEKKMKNGKKDDRTVIAIKITKN